ncbi:MAG: GNAT family protein [Muribaculaceae bacterium]|nr:GNAT family protein [Muribaculaceae bacterium]
MASYIYQHNGIALKALEPDDTSLVYEAENDPLNLAYNGFTAPYSARQLLEYALSYSADPVADRQLRLIGIDIADDTPVGIIDLTDIDMRSLTAIVGVYVFPDRRRQGWSVKLIEAAVEYAKSVLRINRFAAKAAADNEASIRMLHRAGFVEIGRFTDWLYSPATARNVDLLLMQKPASDPRK